VQNLDDVGSLQMSVRRGGDEVAAIMAVSSTAWQMKRDEALYDPFSTY
jgi:hypothetical protein